MHTAYEPEDAKLANKAPGAGQIDFRAFYHGLPSPVALFDGEFRFVETNRAFEAAFGYRSEDVIGLHAWHIYPSEMVDGAVDAFAALRAQGEPFTQSELQIQTQTGLLLDAVVLSNAIVVEGERRYVAIYQDVHESRMRERMLLGRAEMFRVTFDQSPVPQSIHDDQYRLLLVNPAYCEMLGYSEAELIGRDPIDFHIPSQRASIWQERKELQGQVSDDSQHSDSVVREYLHKSGRRVTCQVSMKRSRGIDGSSLWCMTFVDLSKLKRAESEGQAHIDWIWRAFDNAPVGMLVTDENGRVMRSNSTLHELTQIDREGPFDHLLTAQAINTVETMLGGESLRDDDDDIRMGYQGERVALRVAGRGQIWMDRFSSLMRNAVGDELTLTVVSDATREQELKSELHAALSQQSALLHCMEAGLAHVVGEIIVQVNPALSALTGRPQNDLLGQPVEALFGSYSFWHKIKNDLSRGTLRTGSHRTTIELALPDGSNRRCEMLVRRVDVMRVDMEYLVTLTDISDLLDQSDQLRRSVDELEELIDTEPIGIVHLEQGRIVRANLAMRRLIGRGDGLQDGVPFATLCEPDPALRRALAGPSADNASATPQDSVVRANLRSADGDSLPCLLHIAPVGDPARGVQMVVVLDLSQHNAALSLAARMQIRFDAFSTVLDEAMLVVESAGDRVVHANEAVRNVLGIDDADALKWPGKSLWRYVNERDAPKIKKALGHIASGRQFNGVVRLDHPSRGERAVRVRMFAGRSATREYFVLAEDVTDSLLVEKKRLDEAIAHRDALVREVHHRIKNNLQGVAGLLQQNALRQPELAPLLGEVASQVHAIAHVHGLQVGVGQLLQPVELVRAVKESLSSTFGHPVDFFDGEAADVFWGVPEQEAVPLALVINELITNAFKHRSDDAPLAVSVAADDSGFHISVRNNGRLPADFNFDAHPVSPTGLGLIKALIPRRGTSLRYKQRGPTVFVELQLAPPALQRTENQSVAGVSPCPKDLTLK